MSYEKDREHEMKVVDRRRFSSDGELLPGAEDRPDPRPPAESPKPPPATASPKASPSPDAPGPKSGPEPPPNVSGMTLEHLVMSLSTTALLQMGMVEDPEQGRLPPDLTAARQTIDLIGVLMEKTRGNLTAKEQTLFDQVLAELRMAYVRLTGDVEPPPPAAS